ncbi:SDR family oxidoreductase [Paracoccus sp. (in: a-proteobacteria)]|uniref:SDR family oxidoreductase n=1 Tax=Paracoccus sp. TaxID=267 RepID=UPI002729B986|nr:SDR family oxidoreductase [Paracoccus sp. (in: a-proteobacteria)]
MARQPVPRARGKVVVVTGASSGIGRATALAFAQEGATLVLAARDQAALDALAVRCRDAGARAMAVATDITEPPQVARLAREALSFAGRIDMWVANVGTGAVGLYHEVPLAAHERVIRANLLGHMNEAHSAIPIFLRQGHGILVNMNSLGGFAAVPFAAAYSASKFGLRGFSEALRGELTAHPRIHVCDIYPSFVDTPGLAHGANYTGRAQSAPPPVLDARRVAAAVLRLMRHPRPTTMIGAPTRALRLLHAISPELTIRASAAFLRGYFAQARPVPKTDGTLFAPPARPGGIDGGLRSPHRQGMAVAGLALLGLGALAVIARQGRPRRKSEGAPPSPFFHQEDP